MCRCCSTRSSAREEKNLLTFLQNSVDTWVENSYEVRRSTHHRQCWRLYQCDKRSAASSKFLASECVHELPSHVLSCFDCTRTVVYTCCRLGMYTYCDRLCTVVVCVGSWKERSTAAYWLYTSSTPPAGRPTSSCSYAVSSSPRTPATPACKPSKRTYDTHAAVALHDANTVKVSEALVYNSL